jgi:hypothetical protein
MKFIQNMVLSVAAFIAATDICSAQSFLNMPNDTIIKVGALEDLEALSIQQFNNTKDTIILKWSKVSESIPNAWEASICDNSFCNTTLVNSGTMLPINTNEYGFLLLHITPQINYGTAIIRYAVWDEAKPTIKDTLTFILSVKAVSGINEIKNKSNWNINPNPTSSTIIITSRIPSGFIYLITDFTGKEIEKGFSKTNDISIVNLQNGMYHISIMDGNNIIETIKFLVKK